MPAAGHRKGADMSHNTITGSVGYTGPNGTLAYETGFDRARERRIDLRQAMDQLERQLARPTGADSWRAELEAALFELGEALDAHIREVEGDGGLLASIVADTPRLANQAEEMRAEHRQLQAGLGRALAGCSGNSKVEPGQIQRRVTALLGRLALHRQLGSELVFDAYNVDIGDGD